MAAPFNRRETATVLAALRFWQKHGKTGVRTLEEYPVASDGGQVIPLAATEIDALCERINIRGQ